MRIRLFTEIDVNDTVVLELQERLSQSSVELRLTNTPEFLIADSMARQVTKVVESFYGVKESKSVYIPQLLGL